MYAGRYLLRVPKCARVHTKCGRAPGAPLHMLPQLLWRRKGVLVLLRNGPAPAHMGGNKLSIIRLCACARLDYGIYWPLMYYTIHGLVRNKSQGFSVTNVQHIKDTCMYLPIGIQCSHSCVKNYVTIAL